MSYEYFAHFVRDEDGAVTVDWVVLTAAIVGLGIAVLTVVAGSVSDVTTAIDADLDPATGFSAQVRAAFD